MADNITMSLSRMIKQMQGLPQKAYNHFIKYTPVKSGNARRRTRLVGSTIKASYPYASRLDDGYSKQSPDGMTKPTSDFLNRELRKIMRK